MSDFGPATKFLDLEIDRDEDDISISQQAYIKKIFKHFDMHKANGTNYADASLYQSIVRSLMYAALTTRPDLAYTIATLSRYSAEPQARHI
jgi:hypothetical protein